MQAESTREFQPPASQEDLERRLLAMIEHPEFGGCVAYIRANQRKLASARRDEFAAAVATSEANLVSVAQALGFLGYSELRAFVRRFYPLDPERSEEVGLVSAMFPDSRNPFQAFFREAIVAEIRNFEDTYGRNPPEGFMHAVQVLNAARDYRVVILGRRSCFAAAHLFHYLYSLFRGNAVLSQDAGGAGVDVMRWLAQGDVLVVISLAPYTREIVEAVAFAQERGATIVAITDDRASPLAKAAAVSLYFDSATPSFFHSVGTLNVIVQILAALLFYSQAEESLEGFRRAEEQINFFSTYARVEEADTTRDGDRDLPSNTGFKKPGLPPD
jgi:DNA-binding MurR/RpiR family transcriptional regulator